MELELFPDQTVLNKLKVEAKPYLGTLVIFLTEIRLLKDVVIDEADGEPCWKNYDQNGQGHYDSCCLSFIPLKGKLNDEQYNKLVNYWNFNSDYKAI